MNSTIGEGQTLNSKAQSTLDGKPELSQELQVYVDQAGKMTILCRKICMPTLCEKINLMCTLKAKMKQLEVEMDDIVKKFTKFSKTLVKEAMAFW